MSQAAENLRRGARPAALRKGRRALRGAGLQQIYMWVCYLGNHFFCIVNLRPQMKSIATNCMPEVVLDSPYDIKKTLGPYPQVTS
jgi:hypothetical protein